MLLGLVPGVVVGGGVVEFVPANCVAPAGDGAGGLAGLTGLVPGVFEGCVGGHGGQDCRCWLGGQSGCSTTPYQQHVVSYNPERKLSLEATEASRESSQKVRKTNTPLSTASATVYSYSRSWIHASQSKKRFASSGHPSIKQMSSANW